jgi:4-diphosphocytidyl-2-C-methyl-D-erythritol kinase
LAEVEPSDDLIVKAAQALKNYTGTTYGADVGVIKRLPVGGGIGGGSSDAATTLLGLNALWECHLSIDELLDIAVTLGADVPVFVAGHSAWAEGIGEQLTPMDLPEIWFLVLHPGVFVSTAKLFSSEVLTRNKSILKMRDFTDTDIENIFEVIVREQHPEVDLSLSWLNQFSTARMTGTGSCIFAGFDSFEEAEKVLKDVPSKWKSFVAKAVNTSPVFEAINQYSKS